MNDEVCFWHSDKHRSFLQVDTVILGLRNQASLQYLQKSMGDEVDFLPADKGESFLQIDTIFLDVRIQASPKYPK